jgi:hypothetical protein
VRARAALLFALLALGAGRAAAEAIPEFSVEVFLEENGAFTVLERIRYDFGGAQRHGIYREIPLEGGEGFGEARRIRLDVREVTDAGGAPRPWRDETAGGRVHLRIGDPDVTVTGVHDYWISYRVRRAVRFLADRDELAWNVTGNDWRVPIGRAEARVYLPGSGETAAARLRCFAGPYGSKRDACTARAEASSVVFEAEGLRPSDGLTAVIALPKGVLREPSGAERALEWLADGGAWPLLPLAALGLLFALWRSRGVDEGARDAVPVRYEPPEGLTPAEVGTLLDESADVADLNATLLDLAVRGYLDLQEEETTRFLLLSNKDFLIRKRRDADAALKAHERALHDALFDGRDTVRVSALRHKFHVHADRVRSLLYSELSGPGGLFAGPPQQVRAGWYIGAGAILAAALVVGHAGRLATPAPWAVGATGLVVAAFARAMPRRTRRGRRLYEEILGFREFLQRVDRDRLERSGGRTTDRFEHVLPYAIVLGAADAWADAFADLYAKPPDWYRGSHTGRFHPRGFVSDLGRSLDTIGRTLSESPPRSGGGGGGGGGFSGGGSGGGGGGSW